MQEHLVRTGRLAEADQAWLAEALHGAAIADGPGALDAALDQILFILIWPRRTYSLQVELDLQLERLKACLGDSPSLGLFEESIEMAWPMACHKAQALDPALRHLLDAPCPWTTFDGLIAPRCGRGSPKTALPGSTAPRRRHREGARGGSESAPEGGN